MNRNRPFFAALLFVSGLAFGLPASAQEAAKTGAPAKPQPAEAGFTEKGADTCLRCHDEESEFPVLSIFKTKHGVRADKRTPLAGLQCEDCHGPGGMLVEGFAIMSVPPESIGKPGHAEKIRPGQPRPPIISFGRKADEPVELQNRMCLNCHQGQERVGWHGSAHQVGNVACASCHQIHVQEDRVLNKVTQPEVCYTCHKKERAEFFKPSAHPVRFGQIACSECHNTHGTVGEGLLSKPTINQTCYTCHAEKRGPFLWEHAPVAEECTLCHTPHGSVHPALLVKRPPLLCQQCHSQAGHPSVAHTGTGLPGGSPSGFLLAGSCLNCHSQVHGSNHPSGVKLMR